MQRLNMHSLIIQIIIVIIFTSPFINSQSRSVNYKGNVISGTHSNEMFQLASVNYSMGKAEKSGVIEKKVNTEFKNSLNENLPEMFSQVMLSWPVDGEKVYTTSPKLTWLRKSSSLNMIYELEYATLEDMSDATSILSLTTNQIILDGLIPSTKYFWRVRSLEGNNYSVYSQLGSFETGSPEIPIGMEGLTKGF